MIWLFSIVIQLLSFLFVSFVHFVVNYSFPQRLLSVCSTPS
jgi:hypothetical protein